jgi:hypothetical protein
LQLVRPEGAAQHRVLLVGLDDVVQLGVDEHARHLENLGLGEDLHDLVDRGAVVFEHLGPESAARWPRPEPQ